LSQDSKRGKVETPTGRDVKRMCIILQIGTVRGEDFNFKFSGKVKEGKLHFRLEMEYEGDEPQLDNEESRSRTIDFVYDPDDDTPDEIALEIGNEFSLSSTDRDICAAALKEWLAKGLEDQDDEA